MKKTKKPKALAEMLKRMIEDNAENIALEVATGIVERTETENFDCDIVTSDGQGKIIKPSIRLNWNNGWDVDVQVFFPLKESLVNNEEIIIEDYKSCLAVIGTLREVAQYFEDNARKYYEIPEGQPLPRKEPSLRRD